MLIQILNIPDKNIYKTRLNTYDTHDRYILQDNNLSFIDSNMLQFDDMRVIQLCKNFYESCLSSNKRYLPFKFNFISMLEQQQNNKNIFYNYNIAISELHKNHINILLNDTLKEVNKEQLIDQKNYYNNIYTIYEENWGNHILELVLFLVSFTNNIHIYCLQQYEFVKELEDICAVLNLNMRRDDFFISIDTINVNMDRLKKISTFDHKYYFEKILNKQDYVLEEKTLGLFIERWMLNDSWINEEI